MESRENKNPFNIFAEAEFTVEFFDIDPMKVVWHGNYFNYFEIGRRTLLEKINYSYYEMEKSGYAFPVIESSIKYLGALMYRDRARVRSILLEYENRLRIRYEIHNMETGILTTRGLSTQMAYDIRAKESCFVCPRVLIEKVEALIGESP